MECRGVCRRLRLRVRDVGLLHVYNSTARSCGLPKRMAARLALYALDYDVKRIAFGFKVDDSTIREAIATGLQRIGARKRGDCVRILQETDEVRRREYQSF